MGEQSGLAFNGVGMWELDNRSRRRRGRVRWGRGTADAVSEAEGECRGSGFQWGEDLVLAIFEKRRALRLQDGHTPKSQPTTGMTAGLMA